MSWKKLELKDGPSERHSHSAIAVGDDIYVLAGTKSGVAYNDLWALRNGQQWDHVHTSGDVPPAKWGYALQAVGSKLFVFGGDAVGGFTSDLFIFDTVSNKWSKPASVTGVIPSKRAYASTVTVGNKIYLFGGDGGDNHLYALDTDKLDWERVSTGGYSPQARKQAALTVLGNTLYLFGGIDNRDFQYLDDLWTIDLKSMEWVQQKKKGPTPDARAGHLLFPIGQRLFVWGGHHQKLLFNEVNYLDTEEFVWNKKKGSGQIPPGRYSFASAVLKDGIYIFGGATDDKTNLADAYVFTAQGIY